MAKSIWNCPWFLIPVLLFFVGGLVFTYWMPYGYELLLFNAWRVEPYNTFFRWATYLGEAPLWVLVALILLYKRRPYGLALGAALLFLAPFVAIVKHLLAVPRPNTWMDLYNLQSLVVKVPEVQLMGGYNSLPSGHTMVAFTLFSLVTLMLPARYQRVGFLFAVLAMLAGISRIFLVQHFLTDVLLGAGLGLVVSDVIWQIKRRLSVGKSRELAKLSDNPPANHDTNA